MNPGLLDVPLTLEATTGAVDDLGQPLNNWQAAGSFFGRRLKRQISRVNEQEIAERPTEGQAVNFRVRAQPFLTIYREGMRLRAAGRGGLPESVWRIEGWQPLEGSLGMYVDIAAVTPESRE